MQRILDQMIEMGAIKKVGDMNKITDPKKASKDLPTAMLRSLNPPKTIVQPGSNPEQQIQAKAKTKTRSKISRRATMLTGPQGLKDTDLKVKRKRLLGTES